MPISFVGSVSGESGNLTLTGVQEGDVCILVQALDGVSNSRPSGTAAWPQISTGSNNFQVSTVYAHTVTAGEGAAGSVTDDLSWNGGITASTTALMFAYRGVASINSTVVSQGGASTTITYGALTLSATDGTSMVVAIGYHRSVNGSLQTAPSGLSNRIHVIDSVDQLAVHDGLRSSWPATDVAIGGTSSGWRAYVLELIAAASGGGTTQDLAASGSANASGSAALRADVGLAGVGVSVAGGAAGAVASVSLAAAGLALFSGSAGIEAGATVTLTAEGLAQAAGAAGLSADVLLAGAGAAEAAGSAGLAAELRALAAGGAVAGGSAALSGSAAGEIGAVGGVDAGGAAGLLITVSLAGLGGAVAGGSAALETGAGGDLGAAGGAVAAGGGVLSAAVALTAAGFVQAMGAGALAVQFPLSAFGAGLAGGSAVLSDAAGLVLIASPRWRVPATNRRWEVVL